MNELRLMLDVFGDESCGSKFVAYGVLVVPEDQNAAGEAILAEVKKEFGGEANSKLHCRELFAGSSRSKSPWAHLNMADVFRLYEVLMTRLKEVGSRRIVTIARVADFPNHLPPAPMENVNAAAAHPPVWTKAMEFREKQIASFCAQGTMIPLARNPGLDHVRFWADPDTTSIDWIDKKRQATLTISGFIGLDAGKEPPRIKVMPIVGEKPKLLEVADVIAYAAQKTMAGGGGPNERRFQRLHEIIEAGLIRFAVALDGGFGFDVPDAL
jgi:hypothetical protein